MVHFLKKIDFIKYVFLFIITAVFFMYASLYYYNCFPNCYAWKEIMIKWSDGEIVRRGLLGTFFYSLEPYVPVKYSATIVIYICLMICCTCIYNHLKTLRLPFWLFIAIIFSPALFMFSMHYTLLYKKDLIILAACVVVLSFINFYWAKPNSRIESQKKKLIILSIIYVYMYICILLCYEVFIVFVPFICLYTFITVTKCCGAKVAFKLSLFLLFISALLFALLTFPYLGNENIVAGIIKDWGLIYPNFKLENVDPLAFLMMDKQTYLDWYSYIYGKSKLYELALIYFLMIIPLVVILKLNLVKLCIPNEIKPILNRRRFWLYLVLFSVLHFPLSLSLVAFDFGRWFIFTFYLMILFLCFFTERNIEFKNKSKTLFMICFILSVIYVVSWQPYHWAAGGYLITIEEYKIIQNLYEFYSNTNNLTLLFKN